MIVFDASTLVSATFRRRTAPAQAVRHPFQSNRIAVSSRTLAELLDVLYRPGIARLVRAELRAELLGQLHGNGSLFDPAVTVTDCRDPKDNKYLELALASAASIIVSSDADLLMLHPWRGVRVLRPAEYLADVGG